MLAVVKIGGLTGVLLLGGAALYAAGGIRARRRVALAAYNAAGSS